MKWHRREATDGSVERTEPSRGLYSHLRSLCLIDINDINLFSSSDVLLHCVSCWWHIRLMRTHVGCGVSLVESRRLFNFQELAPSIGRSLGEIRGNQEGKSPMEMGSKRQFWVHKKANKKMEV